MALANGIGLPVGTAGLGLGLLNALLAPLFWQLEVAIAHLAARLLRGRGAWHETRAAVGLGAIPQLLAVIPMVGTLWAYVARTIGLRELHQLKLSRAIIAALAPVALAIIGMFCLRSYGLEAFKVPSGSMLPSVELGDHLFVRKSAYGLFSRSLPQRGDIVVFEYPEPNRYEPRVDYVKRVIGLPGDELLFKSGAPFINGWELPRCELGRASADDGSGSTVDYDVFLEFLSGHAYLVAIDGRYDPGVQGPYHVADGEFWVIGDNRNNSSDSRSWHGGKGGGVPLENLRGKAAWIWLPPERFGVDLHDRPVLPASMASLQSKLDECLKRPPDLEHQAPPPP